jgi:hypothetical protein
MCKPRYSSTESVDNGDWGGPTHQRQHNDNPWIRGRHTGRRNGNRDAYADREIDKRQKNPRYSPSVQF